MRVPATHVEPMRPRADALRDDAFEVHVGGVAGDGGTIADELHLANMAAPSPTSCTSRILDVCDPDGGNLGVWSRTLMVHSYGTNQRMRYGPGSSRERHDD
jgi:hypothetical protein